VSLIDISVSAVLNYDVVLQVMSKCIVYGCVIHPAPDIFSRIISPRRLNIAALKKIIIKLAGSLLDKDGDSVLPAQFAMRDCLLGARDISESVLPGSPIHRGRGSAIPPDLRECYDAGLLPLLQSLKPDDSAM
jgi:hypothetical protein